MWVWVPTVCTCHNTIHKYSWTPLNTSLLTGQVVCWQQDHHCGVDSFPGAQLIETDSGSCRLPQPPTQTTTKSRSSLELVSFPGSYSTHNVIIHMNFDPITERWRKILVDFGTWSTTYDVRVDTILCSGKHNLLFWQCLSTHIERNVYTV